MKWTVIAQHWNLLLNMYERKKTKLVRLKLPSLHGFVGV